MEAANDPRICPVRCLRAWLDASGITEGLIFGCLGKDGYELMEPLHPGGGDVARIVKTSARRAGLDPSCNRRAA